MRLLKSWRLNDDDEQEEIDQEKLAAEIEELKSYRDLALSIKANAKGERLVAKLPDVMDEIVNMGGHAKLLSLQVHCTKILS